MKTILLAGKPSVGKTTFIETLLSGTQYSKLTLLQLASAEILEEMFYNTSETLIIDECYPCEFLGDFLREIQERKCWKVVLFITNFSYPTLQNYNFDLKYQISKIK